MSIIRHRFPSLIVPLSLAATIVICLVLGAGTILDRGAPLKADEAWGEVHDAGRIFADAQPVVEHTFQVVNRTSKTIKLVSQSCTCTCTTSGLSQDVLRPNQAATFTMSIKMPGGYSGKSNVSCDLLFDDDRVRTYKIEYESFPRIMIEDSYLDFGTLGPDADRSSGRGDARVVLETWVDLFAPTGQRLPSLEPIQPPEGFEITIADSPGTSETDGIQRRRYAVRVKAKPDVLRSSPGGSFAKSMTFRSDDGSSVLATLIWRRIERYSASPSPVYFGMVEADGASRTMQVMISTSTEHPLEIGTITSDSNYLVVERANPTPATPPHGKHQVLRFVLTVPPEVDHDALSGAVHVAMADEGATAVPIRWSAFVRHRAMASGGQLEVPDGTRKDGMR